MKLIPTLRWLIVCGACAIPLTGCVLTTSGDGGWSVPWSKVAAGNRSDKKSSGDSQGDEQIANPPARTIRFDGHEIVLGNGQATTIATGELLERVRTLQTQSRMRSATSFALQHADAAERLLIERWASADESAMEAIATAQSWRSQSAPEANWTSLIDRVQRDPEACRRYHEIRREFVSALRDGQPVAAMVAPLREAAQAVGHPLVEIDSLRLMGLRELLAEQPEEAMPHYQQAVQKAESVGNLAEAAELGLMVAESARRHGEAAKSAAAWKTAVSRQLTVMSREGVPVDPSFWTRADHLRPDGAQWPDELAMVLVPHCQSIGCRTAVGTGGVSAEMILWAAVGWAQFERGQPQLALVSLKRAETIAEAHDAPWLRIAQSKCLAALGQAPAATALLSGPAASEDAAVAAAATAALGSIKLQSGAFEQGAGLLNKAMSTAPETGWPGRGHAQADLALAQLIIGETEQGLDALHRAQRGFADRGDWKSLVKSLENEANLLEHEHRLTEATAIRKRIAEWEQL